jgi:hypothetical protein
MSKAVRKKERTNEEGARNGPGLSLGVGSEAAEGIHGASKRAQRDNGRASEVRRRGDSARRAGSEPLHHRTVEHKSGYGGEGGAPRTSSHERQQLGTDDRARGEE